MSEKDDSKISHLLKASPPPVPPESFYRGVLEKIERKKGSPSAWNWSIPIKVLATACVLMGVVLVTRETKKSQPELFQQPMKVLHEITASNNSPTPGQEITALKKSSSPGGTERHAEPQSRMDRNISVFVDHPSPFEEVDKEDAKALSARQPWPTQARDTGSGMATQGSFAQSQSLQMNKQKEIRAQEISATPSAASGINLQLAGSAGASRAALLTQKGFEISGPVVGRIILVKTLPVYPEWAQEAGIEGTIRMFVRINSDGTVNPQIRMTQTTGEAKLDQVAVDAVKKWKFSPSPAESWGIITIQFPPKN